MSEVKKLDGEYVAHTYGRFPVQIVCGKGAKLYDESGKEYIDLGSGIAVNTFGAADDMWLRAITRQAGRIPHTSNLYYTEPCALLASKVCQKTGMKKVFYGNSGAEANECAIKAARRWAFKKYGNESHSTIITLKNSFHGRTITTLAATGQDSFHTEFGPFTPGFVYAQPNDAESVEALIQANTPCAVMMEMVQGEGGVCPLDADFVKAVSDMCKKHDMLLIVDEVQTGNGRTGKLFSYMHYGIEPDVFTTAKGIGGGLPIGLCVLGEKVQDVFTPGSHGSTFGGNPVCCAGAISIFDRLTDELMEEVTEKSEYIQEQLKGAKGVKSVTGMGFMLGIECERNAKDVVNDAMAGGVLALTAKAKVRLLPPLNIEWDELKQAVAVLKEALAK